MALYNWKNDYSVGVSIFDNHHKKLFDIANKLHEMMKQGCSKEEIEKTINEMVDYTKYHLAEEEKAMERINYSDISAHKRAHQVFIAEIEGYMKEVENGQAIFVVVKLSKTIVDWLVEHIHKVDKKYMNEMHAEGVK